MELNGMQLNETSAGESLPSYQKILKEYFGDMLVFKSPGRTRFFSELSIPSFMRDWLMMRFSDKDGNINEGQVSDYIKRTIPKKEDWNSLLADLLHGNKSIRILTKVKIDFDTQKKLALFSLPVFDVPAHKGEAVVDWAVIEKHKEQLLAPTEVWGIVEVVLAPSDDGKKNVLRLKDFIPFCPYKIDLEYFVKARDHFTASEWIDVVLSAVDYNPGSYKDEEEKLAVMKRLLPFVEKRINLIELAPKETGKSYMFSQLSQYGWLVSGGSITRAKMFYDISKKTQGLVTRYDYVAFDEIQSIKFPDPLEMQGALKGYLESGEFRVGDHKGSGDAGLALLGNIDTELMDTDTDMFSDLPDIFHDPALLDRFHGFIKGWEIPKMRENMKGHGWALNSEYYSEIMHYLRDEGVYRAVVDRLLVVPADAATRDTEAVKRISTGFLKLIFPNATSVEKVDLKEFDRYCLKPALGMRRIIKKQLAIIDPGEFGGTDIPDIRTAGLEE